MEGRMKGRLYISHFLTSWTDRVFEFACYLLIGDIFKTSLLLASVYGFMTTFSAILWSNWVGRMADRCSRLWFVRTTMVTQKLSIVASCILFYIMSSMNGDGQANQQDEIFNIEVDYFNDNKGDAYSRVPTLIYYIAVVFFGCTLRLAFIGNNIAIEKDWTMVITDGHTESMLTTMRRIDLFCKTVAPAMIGFLMAFGSTVSCIIIAVWNLLSLLIEYRLVLDTYKAYPALAIPKAHTIQIKKARITTTADVEEEQLIEERTPVLESNRNNKYSDNNSDNGSRRNSSNSNHSESISFLQFCRHRIFWASLAMAFLYFTVLSFGGITISYLKTVGYTDWSLGLLRAVAGVAGIASTYLFPYLSARIGVIQSGLWAIWFESLCLVPTVLSFTQWGQNLAIWGPVMLFGGMTLSRVGLWIFDIAETLLLQQLVDNAHIGSVSGWQHSLCYVFNLSQFVLTAVVSHPKDFIIPATVSLGSVLAAAVSYTLFALKERNRQDY